MQNADSEDFANSFRNCVYVEVRRAVEQELQAMRRTIEDLQSAIRTLEQNYADLKTLQGVQQNEIDHNGDALAMVVRVLKARVEFDCGGLHWQQEAMSGISVIGISQFPQYGGGPGHGGLPRDGGGEVESEGESEGECSENGHGAGEGDDGGEDDGGE